MKNDEVIQWADALIATDAKQTTGVLCRIINAPEGQVKTYCCIGFGSELAGVSQHVPHILDGDHVRVEFGNAYENVLAPREFVEWLGLEVPEDDAATGWDLRPDYPEDMTTAEKALHGGYVAAVDDSTLTCAGLNDSGATFAQIGQLIRHFGVVIH